MQQYDEWLIDFQVQHGRKPSDKEVAEAAKEIEQLFNTRCKEFIVWQMKVI